MNITWYCGKVGLVRQVHTGFPTLAEALVTRGIAVRIVDDAPSEDEILKAGPVGVWGDIQLVRRIRELVVPDLAVGVFDQREARDPAAYNPHLAGLLLNSDLREMPLGDVKALPEVRSGPGVFIKPARDAKRFSGFVLSESGRREAERILGDVPADILCAVSPVRADIGSEYRFVVADGLVVAGSQYRRDGRLDVRRDVAAGAEFLAWQVAGLDWQPAPFYVCDVALLTDGTACVVELNPFSSSGLYACDTLEISAAMERYAERLSNELGHGVLAL